MELTLQELKQLLTNTGNVQAAPQTGYGLQVVVLDRGWVFVGNCHDAGDALVIENASCVRRWGTTSGLGQLARDGKQPNTVLDYAGTVTAPYRAVIALIACEPDKWKY